MCTHGRLAANSVELSLAFAASPRISTWRTAEITGGSTAVHWLPSTARALRHQSLRSECGSC